MAFFSLTSCSFIIEKLTGNQSYEVVGLDKKNFALVFSHNVHGETHPCGCRHFPLGGLAQIAGQLEKLKKNHDVLYVDSGDTIFDSTQIPSTLIESRRFNAKGLAKGLYDVGLRYMTPGDYDFADGLDFLKETTGKIKLLIANLKNQESLPHKEFVVIERGPHRIYLTGFVHPSVLNHSLNKLFLPPKSFMPKLLTKMKEHGLDTKNPFHRLVVLSHSGKDLDDQLAKNFPEINWIIGAHTQNFYRIPEEVGKTKIVQVLSRNHYLGQITFDLTKDRTHDSYIVHEVRDELKDELKPNPFLGFIDRHKEEVKKIQLKEQDMMSSVSSEAKMTTTKGCIECHDKQTRWWKGTSHSLAYATLIKANEESNLDCVKCHTLGQGDARGFTRVKDIIEIDKDHLKKKNAEAIKQAYWQEVKKAFSPVKSVRELNTKSKRELANKWLSIDAKNHVNRNFANVQCLNCHVKHNNHPWEELTEAGTKKSIQQGMKNKCLNCHNSDQSPEWYKKMSNGAPGAINPSMLNKKFKEMSCPQMTN